jgi:hypothetical protein
VHRWLLLHDVPGPWVSVGSALKHYVRLAGIPHGHGPLAPAIQFRDKLAHQPLDRLAPEVV